MPAATQQRQVLPGQLFDIPGAPGGGTQRTEQFESIKGLITNLSASTQVSVNLPGNFKQTDVVLDWLWVLKMTTQTYTAGTGQTLTSSAYAPFNAVGPFQLQIQNQYSSVKVESGIDLYIFNLIRPRQALDGGKVNLGANPLGNPVAGTATGYYTTALAQANQFAAQWASSATSWEAIFRIPAAQWFDAYFDLAPTGEPVAPPHAACVSPQYMAGTTRQISPSISFNPGYGSTTDLGPVFTTTLTPTSNSASAFTGVANSTFRRVAAYAGDPTVLPPVYAWQYAWQTTRFSMSGISVIDLPIPLESGQVLAIYIRMFDPSANGGLGAPININSLTKQQLQYGSGLLRFDDTPDTVQERWLRQHNQLLPQGVFCWDLALNERAQVSNAMALNLLTTAGCLVHLEFTGTLSSTAYAVMGVESLVYVS